MSSGAGAEGFTDSLGPHTMSEILARFIDVCERKGTMRQAEADEWRLRIQARQRFLELEGNTTAA